MAKLTTNDTQITSKSFTLPSGYTSELRLYAKYTKQDVTNNTTTVSYRVVLYNKYPWYASNPIYGYVGSSETNNTTGSKTFTSSSMSAANTEYTLATYTTTINHNEDGTKTGVKIYGKITQKNWSVDTGWVSGSFDLPKMERHPEWTTPPSISSKEENKIVLNLGKTNIASTFACSCTTDTSKVGSISGNTVTFTGLTANKSYDFLVTATGTSSKLSSTTTITEKTYAWPSLTSIKISALKPGDKQILTVNNPLGRTLTVVAKCASSSGTSVYSGTSTSNTTIDFTPTNSSTGLFNTTDGLGTTKTSIKIYYAITYNGQTSSQMGTVVTNANDYKPTWTSGATAAKAILYKDITSATVNITGSNQKLVGDKSTIQATLANLADQTITTVKSSVAKYEMVASYENIIPTDPWTEIKTKGTYQTITGASVIDNTKSQLYIYLRGVDARGYKSDPLKLTIPIINYSKPTGSVDIRRENNFGEVVQIIIKPSWSVGTGNTGTATVYYKINSSESSYITTMSNVSTFNSYINIKNSTGTQNVVFDNSLTYNVKVVLTDKFGGKSSEIVTTIGPGTPIFFIDSSKNGIGVNCFPESSGTYTDNLIVTKHHCKCSVGNSNTYPYHRFAYTDILTGNNVDRSALFIINKGFDGGGFGIFRATLRTNNNKDSSTYSPSRVEIKWLVRDKNLSEDCIQYGLHTELQKTYASLFYKCPGTYGSAHIQVLEESNRGTYINNSNQWKLQNTSLSNDDTNPLNVYTSINDYEKFTVTGVATDVGQVSYAKTAGTAASATKATDADNAKKATSATIATDSNYTARMKSPSTRLADANLSHEYVSDRVTSRVDIASGSMTSNKPSSDGFINTYFWDTSNGYDSQLFVPNSNTRRMSLRTKGNATWTNWKELAYFSDIPTDSGWINVPLASGISVGSHGTPQYKKVGNQVFLRGGYKGTKASGSTLTLGTLPSGYRPPHNTYYIATLVGQRIARIVITTSGTIVIDWIFTLTSTSEWNGSFDWLFFTFNFWID